jgi:tetratricopeptide (TPR) repeat protein
MPKHLVSTVGAIVFVAVTATGCHDRSETLFSDARRAMEDDSYETAARLYQEVTIQTPDSALAADAYFELAQIYYLRLRDVDAAKDSLVKLLHDYPRSRVDVEARRFLARLYEEDLQEPNRALKLYRDVLAGNLEEETRRQTLLDIGDCHYRIGELDASANAYRLALGLPYTSDTDSVYMRLANLEWLGGSADESLRLLRELQERTLDDDYRHEAILREVEVLMSLGRFSSARARVEGAQELFPASLDVTEVVARLDEAERLHQSLEGEGEVALLQELQKKIQWGGGRRRRRAPSQ